MVPEQVETSKTTTLSYERARKQIQASKPRERNAATALLDHTMAGNMAIAPREKMCITGNQRVNWNSFKQRLELYLITTGQTAKFDEQKVALLPSMARTGDVDVYSTLRFGGPTSAMQERGNVPSVVNAKLDSYFTPKRNYVYPRHFLRCRRQEPREALRNISHRPQSKSERRQPRRATRKNIFGDQAIFVINNEVLMKL